MVKRKVNLEKKRCHQVRVLVNKGFFGFGIYFRGWLKYFFCENMFLRTGEKPIFRGNLVSQMYLLFRKTAKISDNKVISQIWSATFGNAWFQNQQVLCNFWVRSNPCENRIISNVYSYVLKKMKSVNFS